MSVDVTSTRNCQKMQQPRKYWKKYLAHFAAVMGLFLE